MNCAPGATLCRKTRPQHDGGCTAGDKRNIYEFMFHGLSRDYWPVEAKNIFLRTVLSFILAPVFAAAALFVLLLIVEMALQGTIDIGHSRTVQVAPIILIGSIIVTLTGGIIAFLVLWSLRLRGRMHYALAGIIMGAALAFVFLIARSEPIHPTAMILAAIHLGIVMLVLRAIVGIRRIDV